MRSETSAAPAQARHDPDRRCCRFCATPLRHVMIDLGMSPLANAFLKREDLQACEQFYPLRVYVCEECLLVQLEEWKAPETIFSDYAYFSSFSDSWLAHARAYVEQVSERFGIDQRSFVVEIASNDGYLLQYFHERKVPLLGIEPAWNVAEVARRRGITTVGKFFGEQTARDLVESGVRPDLLIGNNVLAHVPNLTDFVRGLKILLSDTGVVTMEFPHLMRLMEEGQIDTIYHEHYSYFSFLTVERIFAAHGLRLFDVEELPTHGGSLRIYACHAQYAGHADGDRLDALRARERAFGLDTLARYQSFGETAHQLKWALLRFLIDVKLAGKRIIAYGATAKGNTLLNFCGVRSDFIDYSVDRSPHKQGQFLPGTHIRVEHPDNIRATRPDYVLILAWNLKAEIVEQLGYIRQWGGQFVVPIPTTQIVGAET